MVFKSHGLLLFLCFIVHSIFLSLVPMFKGRGQSEISTKTNLLFFILGKIQNLNHKSMCYITAVNNSWLTPRPGKQSKLWDLAAPMF